MIKESKYRKKTNKLPRHLAGTSGFRCALWSLLPASARSNNLKRQIRRNRTENEDENQDEIQITLKEVLESWISKIKKWNSKRRTINSKWSQYH